MYFKSVEVIWIPNGFCMHVYEQSRQNTKLILLACWGLEIFDRQKCEFQIYTTQSQNSDVWLHLPVVATPLVKASHDYCFSTIDLG